jgi:uracil-DNA glycosylase
VAPGKTLAAAVQNFREYLPEYFVLPHPSPRNNIGQANSSGFREEVLPVLGEATFSVLGQ